MIVPLVRKTMREDASLLTPFSCRLVKILTCANLVFIADYKLKKRTWALIIELLHQMQLQRVDMEHLFKSKLLKHLFARFEMWNDNGNEESKLARVILMENNAQEIDGIPRREVERLTYSKFKDTTQKFKSFNEGRMH